MTPEREAEYDRVMEPHRMQMMGALGWCFGAVVSFLATGLKLPWWLAMAFGAFLVVAEFCSGWRAYLRVTKGDD